MDVIFGPIDKQETINQFENIAAHYKTEVYDTGEGYSIFVKAKIKITEKIRNDKKYIFVWGANEEDISFLKQFWGNPIDIIAEKMTPMEFVTKVVELPNIEQLSKEEIINALKINKEEYTKYLKSIKRLGKRPNSPPKVIKAVSILKDK